VYGGVIYYDGADHNTLIVGTTTSNDTAREGGGARAGSHPPRAAVKGLVDVKLRQDPRAVRRR